MTDVSSPHTHNPPSPSTPKATRKRARRGKKLPQLIQDTLASFPTKQPLRLMFQDEARIGIAVCQRAVDERVSR